MARCISIFVAAFAMSAAISDDVKENGLQAEMEKLQGKWKLTSVDCKGRLCPPKLENVYLIKGDKWQSLTSDGKVYAESVFRLDPTQTPKALDKSAGVESKDGKFHFKGIYKLEDDMLTIHFSLARTNCANEVLRRPKDFQITDAGIILTYQRVKQKR